VLGKVRALESNTCLRAITLDPSHLTICRDYLTSRPNSRLMLGHQVAFTQRVPIVWAWRESHHTKQPPHSHFSGGNYC